MSWEIYQKTKETPFCSRPVNAKWIRMEEGCAAHPDPTRTSHGRSELSAQADTHLRHKGTEPKQSNSLSIPLRQSLKGQSANRPSLSRAMVRNTYTFLIWGVQVWKCSLSLRKLKEGLQMNNLYAANFQIPLSLKIALLLFTSIFSIFSLTPECLLCSV